jgi:MFS family permease
LHPITLAILLAASSLTAMAGATIAPSLPALTRHFAEVPDVDLLVKLVLTAPGLAIAVCAPLAGLLADKWGRRPTLAIGVALYVLSGASGLVVDGIAALLVGRVLLGVAVALVMTSATALIGDLTAPADRARTSGLQAAAMGIGGVVFLLLGGVLAEFSWRGPFAVYLLPIVLLPLIPMFLPARSFAAAAPGAAPARMPWRAVMPIFAFGFLSMVVFYIIPIQLPFHMNGLGVASTAMAGVGIATATSCSAIASMVLVARLKARVGISGTLAASFGIVALGFGVVGLAPSLPVLFVGLGIAGAGLGLQMPLLVSMLQTAAPAELRGRAAGGYTMAVFLGQFVSPFVHGPTSRLVGYDGAFLAVAAACLVTIAVVLLADPLGLKREATAAPVTGS